MGNNSKIKSKKIKSIIFLIVLILIDIILISYKYNSSSKYKSLDNNFSKANEKEIKEHYGKYVKTNKETKIYKKNGIAFGTIGKDVELTLNDMSDNSGYFNITDFNNEYYIYYNDVDKIDSLSEKDNRYKKYIVFNKNIITKQSKTNFYDNQSNLIYSFNKSFDLPIIVQEDDKYGVEFNNQLLYVLKTDIDNVKNSLNTSKKNASGVGVLNYHAFYDENNPEEVADCNTIICHSKKQFRDQLEFFKEKELFTLKMQELEMYLDGKIQLPKSVLITIDDGGRTYGGIDLLTEYKMNATIFLITSWFDLDTYYKTDYIEFHSHSDDMHNTGVCPWGQGGGIRCLPEETIQKDLKASREKLNNTPYFCYPFYEYNDYAINMLKKAGFRMAFIGESTSSDNLVHIDSDRFKLRRFVITTYTTIADLDAYFNQIH